jgi:catechol 2,3-dioxygenase-like lactoylglutathione lyase family enzyme
MKLTFLFQPVSDLKQAAEFYRALGLDESWREGEDTVAFALPGSEVELMVCVPPGDGPEWRGGGMYLVDSVERFIAEHPDLKWAGEVSELPGGRSAAFLDPAGNAIHLFDQSTEGSGE